MEIIINTLAVIWLITTILIPIYIVSRISVELIPVYGNYYFVHKLVWNNRIDPKRKNIYLGLFFISCLVAILSYELINSKNISDIIFAFLLYPPLQVILVVLLENKIGDFKNFKFQNIINTVQKILNNFIYQKNIESNENKNKTIESIDYFEINNQFENDVLEELYTLKNIITKSLEPIIKIDLKKNENELEIQKDILIKSKFENESIKVDFPFENIDMKAYEELLKNFESSGKFIIHKRQINNILLFRKNDYKIICKYKGRNKKGNKLQLLKELNTILNFVDKENNKTTLEYLNTYFQVEGANEFVSNDISKLRRFCYQKK